MKLRNMSLRETICHNFSWSRNLQLTLRWQNIIPLCAFLSLNNQLFFQIRTKGVLVFCCWISRQASVSGFSRSLLHSFASIRKDKCCLVHYHKPWFQCYCDFPTCTLFFLLGGSENIISLSSHLLDWLHWKAHYT